MASGASSPANNASCSPEPQDTIQIFVRNVSGDTTSLTVPPTTTIATIKSLLAAHSATPTPSTNSRLIFAGKHLTDPSSTLASHGIPSASTLHLALPLRSGAPKKIRCSFKTCKEQAQRIVGDCGFCSGRFCGKHRLLEDHKCEGLEDCKKESHERNASKLESERTVVVKGV